MAETALKRFGTRTIALHAACYAIPAMLFIAHMNQGADAQAAAAWMCLGACGALLGILLLRPYETIPTSIPLLSLVLAACTISGLAGNGYLARAEILQLAGALALWSAGTLLAQSRRLLGLSWTSLSASLAMVGAMALISYPLSAAGYDHAQANRAAFRLSFTFGSPNVLASLMGLATIVSAVHLVYLLRTRVASDIPLLAKFSHMPRSGYVSTFALLVCMSCLILTLSRAAISLTLAIMAASFAIHTAMQRTGQAGTGGFFRNRMIAAALILVLSLVLIVLAMSGGQIGARTGALETDSAARWTIFAEYWNAWQEKPLFGHGLGAFNRVNESITTMENARYLVPMGAAHNVVLQWLVQAGLAGFGVMAGVFAWMHWKVAQAARPSSGNSSQYFALAALMASAFLVLHNMVDFSLEIPSVMWTYAFLLGLACGTAMKQQPRNRGA